MLVRLFAFVYVFVRSGNLLGAQGRRSAFARRVLQAIKLLHCWSWLHMIHYCGTDEGIPCCSSRSEACDKVIMLFSSVLFTITSFVGLFYLLLRSYSTKLLLLPDVDQFAMAKCYSPSRNTVLFVGVACLLGGLPRARALILLF